MNYSKKIKKTGLFYYRREKLLRKWAEANQTNQLVNGDDNRQLPCFSPSKINIRTKRNTNSHGTPPLKPILVSVPGQNEEYGLDSDKIENLSLLESIRYWALKTNQTHQSINLIMDIIRRKTNGKTLPRSARTLLQTSREETSNIVPLSGGQYWYKGIKQCLLEYFRNIEAPVAISINVNIDGIPIYKSSKSQFWPILFNIHEMPEVGPVPIAIFYGSSKPISVEEFLQPFVNELMEIVPHGLLVNNHKLEVRIRCFICYSPARAFIKGVANFNSKNGCLKCTCQGEYSHESRTVVFKSINSAKRTDKEFRTNTYDRHHKVVTPLLRILKLDLIQDIIVSDRLHLVDLGIMKRLLLGWRDGLFGFKTKLSSQQINQISTMLQDIELPSEIHRKFRGLDCLSFWKGSELNSFLHYASIVVMKEFLPIDAYQHFLLFFCSITMLTSEAYKSNWQVSEKMIEKFVSEYMVIYGEQYVTSNVHNLLNIVDEAEVFGPLHTTSAYPFENALQRIKNLLRSGYRSLEQAVNRLSEIHAQEYYTTQQSKSNKKTIPSVVTNSNYKGIEVKNGLFLSTSKRNCWFLTKKNEIVHFDNVSEHSDRIVIFGKILNDKFDFFTYPFPSSVLNISRGDISKLSLKINHFECSDIKSQKVHLDR
ncbi:uncharacterized protein LOC129720425 [Wyeomyia smithii]|uniref:uncharacterized protein LOC129720425 n=1 Tax=Wyeomyia smithii TaxID=174621 RepID=UPI0024680EA5|nr:uncharacterized protein LOC129720425 [Wyeomyia smithii]